MHQKGSIEPLLNIHNLRTFFFTSQGTSRAVDGVSYSLFERETIGIVGESGSGKSVSALSILRLVPEPQGKIVDGEIWFDGVDLLKASEVRMREIRGNRISMIFQDPMTSLNPVFTIGNQISEAFVLHMGLGQKDALDQSVEILKLVRIPSPEKRVREYPYQLSGGMRQRAMIAMALACHPKVLIADEPTTALDVTIQAQILELINRIKEETGTSIIMITHNLGVIAEMAERVLVMYSGKIMEAAPVDEIFHHPLHPYTKGLLETVPRIDREVRSDKRLPEISGMIPSLQELPPGCHFHPRCPHAIDICRREEPGLREIEDQHLCRCWLVSE